MRFFLTAFITFSFSSTCVLASVIQLKNQGDTVSLELSGQSDWNYELKRKTEKGQTKVVLVVKDNDPQSLEKIKNIKNPFIKSIQVKPELVDGKKQIEFILSNNKVETFDYLTDYPSKLIVDFYYNEEPVATEAAKVKNKTAANTSGKGQRNPAGTDHFEIDEMGNRINLNIGLFKSSDDRFERFKINLAELVPPPPPYELSEYYSGYPLLERPFWFWTKMKENLPVYEIQPESHAENKQIRLIKKLFDKKRTFVLRQTTEWFAKKYPNSKYLEMAYAMTADSHIQLWQAENKNEHFDVAQFYYDKILKQYPQSALFERTSLAIGMYELDKKNYLVALRKFKSHIENPKYKDKGSHAYAQLGMSYCLARLNKIDEAVKLSEEIENTSSDELTQAEAAYRKGDYLMMSAKYMDTKNQYEAAAKKYPKMEALFPNGVFNKMEAFFQMQMSMEAHATALDFVKKFPQDEYAPYALTRLGELLDIVGAPQEKAIGAYLETQFRYGESPKTIVARLHLLSTRMKVMQELELKQTIQKMNELAGKSDLSDINLFKTIMLSDGFSRRKEFDKAIDILVKYYQEFPGRKNSEQVSSRIRNNIHGYLRDLSDNNRGREVLKIYREYANNWLRNHESADTYYNLGKAYQSAGAYEEALKKYEQAELALVDSRSQALARRWALPKVESIYLKQAQSLFEQNSFNKSEETLDKIKNTEVLSPADQIARVNLASQLHERRGDNDTAIRYLSEIVQLWKQESNLVTESAIRLAKLWNKAENPQKGLDLLDGILKEKLNPDSIRKIYKTKSEIAISAKLSDAAISSLSFILNTDEFQKTNLAEERFRLGDLYFQKGELKKAQNIWSNFSQQDDKFWSKLADEKMRSAQWQDEYKKYLKRVPATVGVQ